MKTIAVSLLLALLSWLPTGEAGADDGLAELAAGKRGAAIRLNVPARLAYGAFISDDGLALVDLAMVAMKAKPAVSVADGTPLKFGNILGIFPAHGLALMKFEHRPRVWLSIAPKEPEVGEPIALIPLNSEDLLDGQMSSVVGPVMAKRTGLTPGLRVAQFSKILSLGSYLSSEQRAALGPGSFAIDRRGDLVAFFNGKREHDKQTLVLLAHVTSLVETVGKLAKGEEFIPFPLPRDKNPVDLALIDPDLYFLVAAKHQGDKAKEKALLRGLLERHPNSISLKVIAADASDESLVDLADIPQPDPKTPAAQQVRVQNARAKLLQREGDYKGAVQALEDAIALCPADFPEIRIHLAGILEEPKAKLDRLDDAERLYKEAYSSMPESKELLSRLEQLLKYRGKRAEASKLSERWFELDNIYRGRVATSRAKGPPK